VQQWSLFASNAAAAAPQDLFEDLASDEESPEQLSRRPTPKAPQFSLYIDNGEAEVPRGTISQLLCCIFSRRQGLG
jgi:hypothetical protein